jgi:hypothetical protein
MNRTSRISISRPEAQFRIFPMLPDAAVRIESAFVDRVLEAARVPHMVEISDNQQGYRIVLTHPSDPSVDIPLCMRVEGAGEAQQILRYNSRDALPVAAQFLHANVSEPMKRILTLQYFAQSQNIPAEHYDLSMSENSPLLKSPIYGIIMYLEYPGPLRPTTHVMLTIEYSVKYSDIRWDLTLADPKSGHKD